LFSSHECGHFLQIDRKATIWFGFLSIPTGLRKTPLFWLHAPLKDYEFKEGPGDLDAGDSPIRTVRLSELFTIPGRV
jgi:hypothetical protein